MGILVVIEIIEGEGLADLRERGFARLVLDVNIGAAAARYIVDIPFADRVGEGLPHILVEAVAHPQIPAEIAFRVGVGLPAGGVGVGDRAEQIPAGDEIAVQEIRVGHTNIDLGAVLGDHRVDRGVHARADEIILAEAGIHQRAQRGGVAAAERELARRLLGHRRVENHLLLGGARRGGDLFILEEAEILQILGGAVDLALIIGIAFRHRQFPADHLILGAGVAGDIDPLNPDPRAINDIQHDIERVRLGIGRDLRVDRGERVTEIRGALGESVHPFLQRIAVEPIPLGEGHQAAQFLR